MKSRLHIILIAVACITPAVRAQHRADQHIKAVLCPGDLVEQNENSIMNRTMLNQTSREMWKKTGVAALTNRIGIPSLENAAFEITAPAWGTILIITSEFHPRDEVLEWALKRRMRINIKTAPSFISERRCTRRMLLSRNNKN